MMFPEGLGTETDTNGTEEVNSVVFMMSSADVARGYNKGVKICAGKNNDTSKHIYPNINIIEHKGIIHILAISEKNDILLK